MRLDDKQERRLTDLALGQAAPAAPAAGVKEALSRARK
jgi:hypothetical protein